MSTITFYLSTSYYKNIGFCNETAQTFVFSCSTPIPSVAQSAEADLWSGWYGAAEKGSGDGAGAVEADHTPPTNCTSTNGTSARRVLLPVQDPACPS